VALSILAAAAAPCVTGGAARLAAQAARPGGGGVPWTFRWGVQRPDLVRYNRVEGLSVGARAQLRLPSRVGPISVSATARLGSADRDPDTRLELVRETLGSRLTLAGYRELAAVDVRGRYLGVGASLASLLFGRDDGEYFRRTGVAFDVGPPSSVWRSFLVRLYAERHRAASRNADFNVTRLLGGGARFRPVVVAERGREAGVLAVLHPRRGDDPSRPRVDLEVRTRAAVGTWSYLRLQVTGRATLPLAERWRVDLEAAGGASRGALPAQRLWFLGGPFTLRGYAPAALVGDAFVRGRAEIARTFAFGSVALLADGAWAGARGAVAPGDGLVAVGAALRLVDGLIRLDLARGLVAPRGWRADAYLDVVR